MSSDRPESAQESRAAAEAGHEAGGPRSRAEVGARIACVRAYHLSWPMGEPFGFSQWQYATREATLVQVLAEDGAEGWGECYGPAAPTHAAVVSCYAPLLVGRDALHTGVIWHRMWQSSLDFARRGVMMAAMSGLDMALWDLKGRMLGLPLSVLLGGPARQSIPCYATGMYFRDRPDGQLIDELLAEATAHYASGFSRLKVKIGRSQAFDMRLIREMRRALPEATLMADANHAYDLPEAIAIGKTLADHGYAWFEEPLSPEHPRLYRQLHDAVAVPLAAGECEQTRFGFQALLSGGGVDIAQPDLGYCGGVSEALKIRAIASSYGVNVIPHVWGTMLSIAAAVHFLAADFRQPGRAEPVAGLLECDRTTNHLRDALFRTPVYIRDAVAQVPTAPGLGVEVDTGAVAAVCVHTEEIS